MENLQIWGGLECTLNRVGNSFFDQLEKNGHYTRRSDLDLFKELNISKIRYPCLWEKISPTRIDKFNWDWLDERLVDLKNLNIDIIAGFLHHGSGPHYTNLLDPEFPEKFSYFAQKFIQRYPWINHFTPINEINTTARFSCLYGHWYPHHKTDKSYLQALLNQARATILCMEEIKKINPQAKLIQTDDLGEAQGTSKLRDQVDFENHRRWLAWDLLFGKIGTDHPLFQYLISSGINLDDLNWFQKNKGPPDVIGINHYPLSNRFLDENLNDYPEYLHGSNNIFKYADVGAVDSGKANIIGLVDILEKTFKRYSVPIAITEIHSRGYRESQIRWFHHIWTQVHQAREKDINVISITPWSLLGTYDWNKLCTTNDYFYEPGVFDLRTSQGRPKKTAISKIISNLSSQSTFESQVLNYNSWSACREIHYAKNFIKDERSSFRGRTILVTGKNGTLGSAFLKICEQRKIPAVGINRKECDLSNFEELNQIIKQINPWAIIHTAGFVDIERAELEPEKCFQDNVRATENLCIIANEKKLRFVSFSSDMVFDGTQGTPYLENSPLNPINFYGHSKASAEKIIQQIMPNSLIIRSSSFFGPWDQYNFLTTNIHRLKTNNAVLIINDLKISPTYVPDLVNSSLDLLIDDEEGIVHLVNPSEITWLDFLKKALDKFKLLKQYSHLITSTEFNVLKLTSKRPSYSVLGSYRHNYLPELDDAISRYHSELIP
jgi:dTDP-4-dehydrorhamnose reductase